MPTFPIDKQIAEVRAVLETPGLVRAVRIAQVETPCSEVT
jgi:hypothetical protein